MKVVQKLKELGTISYVITVNEMAHTVYASVWMSETERLSSMFVE